MNSDERAALERLCDAVLGDPSTGMPPLDADPIAVILGLVDPDQGD
jgi:hypothetical protein